MTAEEGPQTNVTGLFPLTSVLKVEDSATCPLFPMFPPESAPPSCDNLITVSYLLDEPGLCFITATRDGDVKHNVH